MKDNSSELIGWGIVAVIAAVFIHYYWHFLLIALGIFGLVYVVREFNRNNKN